MDVERYMSNPRYAGIFREALNDDGSNPAGLYARLEAAMGYAVGDEAARKLRMMRDANRVNASNASLGNQRQLLEMAKTNQANRYGLARAGLDIARDRFNTANAIRADQTGRQASDANMAALLQGGGLLANTGLAMQQRGINNALTKRLLEGGV